MSDRDTHFAGWARLLYPEVSKRFFTMYARISERRPIEEIDEIEDEIKTLLAQDGYDLLNYARIHVDNALYESVGYYGGPVSEFWGAEDIPDLTTLPEHSE